MTKGAASRYRLSREQERIWGCPVSRRFGRVQCEIRAFGALDPHRLSAAAARVVSEHEMLRTTFPAAGGFGGPLQEVHTTGSFDHAQFDSRGSENTERALEARFDAEFSRPREPDHAPVRLVSVRLTRDRWGLLLSLPALSADTTSLRLLHAALARAYAAERREAAPRSPLQYVDYSEWQHQVLGELAPPLGGEFDAAALPRLPHERRGTPAFDGPPATLRSRVDNEQAARIEACAKVREADLETFLLTAWGVLLWRLGNAPSLWLGTRSDGRVEDLAGVIGPIGAPLAVSLATRPGASFEETLAAVAPAGARPQHPIPDDVGGWVGFGFQELPLPCDAGGVRFAMSRCRTWSHPFKLALEVERGDDGLAVEILFDPALYDRSEIGRLGERFDTLLRSASEAPDTPLEALPIVGRRERHWLLVENNPQPQPAEPQACFHQLFEAQASRTPERTAVVHGAERLSYAELNARANRLAHLLRDAGVGPETTVGVCLARSPDLVVALLGILKAGGAYVPVDASYPERRIAFVLEDAGVALVLTDGRSEGRLPASGPPRLRLDAASEALASRPADHPRVPVDPVNLAYLIYTSGSTGRPKGVMVPHSGLVHYVRFAAAAYRIEEGTGALVHSPIAFDLTVTSLLVPLSRGQAVRLVDDEAGVEGLAVALEELRDATLVKLTPSHLDALRHLLCPERAADATRLLVIGGEQLRYGDLEFFRRAAPETRLVNEYGPTEAVVGCCVHEVSRTAPTSGVVPIGRPIPGASLYVLDESLEPTPAGVPGEIYIGGAGVARGYWRRPELTEERFLPDPFSDREGARLYRTGDLARHLPDGQLEYLGRNDHQVKIRGHRVELGEIEAVLSDHPDVDQAVAIADEGGETGSPLIAFLVARPGAAPGEDELRAFAAARLPEHMVPPRLVALDALPLTGNGKVDRRALIERGRADRQRRRDTTPPRSPAEKILAAIWSELLGVEGIGVYDDFFELGGDSILALEAGYRARLAGLYFAPRVFLEHSTLEDLARAARQECAAVAEQDALVGAVPLTPIQCWHFERNGPDFQHYNIAFLLETREPLELDSLDLALAAVIGHHDALRLRFERRPGGWEQSYAAREAVEARVERIDHRALPPSEQASALEEVANRLQSGFDLGSPPLLRLAHLDRASPGTGRLLVVVHHLVADGVSIRILLEDLFTAYQACRRGEAPRLPEKTTSYRAWAERLHDHARSDRVEAEVAFWTHADDRGELARLPSEGREAFEGETQKLWTSLDRETTEIALRGAPGLSGSRVTDVLVAAFARALWGLTGRGPILIDLFTHGREDLFPDADVSRTVGWFNSFFPLRLDPAAATAPLDDLREVVARLRQIPQNGIGYGLLARLGAEHVASRIRQLARPDFAFSYLGKFDTRHAGELPLVPVGEPCGRSRSSRLRRSHAISAMALVVDGTLHLEWSFDARTGAERMRGLAAAWEREMVALAHAGPASHRHAGATGAGT